MKWVWVLLLALFVSLPLAQTATAEGGLSIAQKVKRRICEVKLPELLERALDYKDEQKGDPSLKKAVKTELLRHELKDGSFKKGTRNYAEMEKMLYFYFRFAYETEEEAGRTYTLLLGQKLCKRGTLLAPQTKKELARLER